MHHYNGTNYCSTETVFLIFPFLQTNIKSQMWPSGGKAWGEGGVLTNEGCRLCLVEMQFQLTKPAYEVMHNSLFLPYRWAKPLPVLQCPPIEEKVDLHTQLGNKKRQHKTQWLTCRMLMLRSSRSPIRRTSLTPDVHCTPSLQMHQPIWPIRPCGRQYSAN